MKSNALILTEVPDSLRLAICDKSVQNGRLPTSAKVPE